MRQLCLLFMVVVCACSAEDHLSPASGTTTGGHGGPTLSLTCKACLQSSECSGGACAQYGGSDYCGNTCKSSADCGSDETCTLLVATDASEVQICIPNSATCGSGPGCSNCAAGATCDIVAGLCVDANSGGTSDTGGTSGSTGSTTAGTTSSGGCPGYDDPSTSSCCKSCNTGSSGCQANGCYGGWYCDSNACKCHAPPSNCGGGTTGTTGGGTTGTTGGGTTGSGGGPPPTGTIGPTGGSVSSLYFAIVGDTRPANPDETSAYPTTIINKIYADIAALNPQPQFVVTTGDYMFANTSGSQAQPQMTLYAQAAAQFKTGPIFAAMGNHECTGATDSNCASSQTSNLKAFMSTMMKPLGQTTPYYSIPISDSAGSWTAKIVVAACNAWDSTQETWLQGELAKSTTYTFVVRHEPLGTSGPPCVAPMDTMLKSATYDLFIVGHSHEFSHSGSQVIVGNGGAPLSGSGNYGFATVAQQSSGFLVTQYDYMTSLPIGSFTVK